jgi:hypothetical protein
MTVSEESTGGSTPRRGRHGLIALAVIAALGVAIAGLAIWRGADSDDLAAPDQRPAVLPQGLRSEAAPNSAYLIFTLKFNSTANVKVKPLWDADNNCVKDNPFPDSYDGAGSTSGIRISATKNSSGSCAVEVSRMHWRVESQGFAEEVKLHSGINGTVVECVDLEGRDHWNVTCSNQGSYPSDGGTVDVTWRG